MKPIALVISCEHAVNNVPTVYLDLFASDPSVLHSHQAIDFGSAFLANHLAQTFACDYTAATVTRLLIDCNRSLRHRHCFSSWSMPLSLPVKNTLISTYYQPFRQSVQDAIAKHVAQGRQVLHLSIHSFTPWLFEKERTCDIGFLYDPKRVDEKAWSRHWQQAIRLAAPHLRVRMNYPYRGVSDGFTTALRRQFAPQDYMGLEIETNERLMKPDASRLILTQLLTSTLQPLILARQGDSHRV